MIQLYVLVAGGLAIAAASFTAGWQVNDWRHDAAELQRQQKLAQDSRRAAAQIDRAAEAHAARQAAADAREAELERRTYAELQKPDSGAACLSPDGLRILADAAAESNARRGLAPALPASAAAR
jgi:hypothetical protein